MADRVLTVLEVLKAGTVWVKTNFLIYRVDLCIG